MLHLVEKKDIYIEWLKASIKKHDLVIKEFDLKYSENPIK